MLISFIFYILKSTLLDIRGKNYNQLKEQIRKT